MNGLTAMKSITDIHEKYIEAALLTGTESNKVSSDKPKRVHNGFWNSGWTAAAICAVVGIGVYVTLLGLGKGWFTSPAGHPNATETETEMIADSEAESSSTDTEATLLYSVGLSYGNTRYGFGVTGIGTCTDTVITVSPTVDGKPVTAVGDKAFNENKTVQSVVLPDSVTAIGVMAFSNCASLETVRMPCNNETNIMSNAFSGCPSLTEIYLYDGTSCEWGLFYGDSALKTIRLPADLTVIGDKTFGGCSSLTAIELPAGLRKIGYSAFEGCTSLSELTLPEGLVSIGGSAFVFCAFDLNTFKIPHSVQYVGVGAFQAVGAIPAIIYENDAGALEEDGTPLKTYDLYVDGCLIYVATSQPSYTVREGTRLIAEAALDIWMYLPLNQTAEITLPDSLAIICRDWISTERIRLFTIHGEWMDLPVTDY